MCVSVLLYLCVCEEENGVFPFDACHCEQTLEVLVEGLVVVAAGQLNLEALVVVDVGCQPVNGHHT